MDTKFENCKTGINATAIHGKVVVNHYLGTNDIIHFSKASYRPDKACCHLIQMVPSRFI